MYHIRNIKTIKKKNNKIKTKITKITKINKLQLSSSFMDTVAYSCVYKNTVYKSPTCDFTGILQ